MKIERRTIRDEIRTVAARFAARYQVRVEQPTKAEGWKPLPAADPEAK